MNRHPRDDNWDKSSLSEYPTDEIEPETIDITPTSSYEVVVSLYNWLSELYADSNRDGHEHGFYVDSYGNVIGVIDGGETSVDFPNDYRLNRTCMVHTHPKGYPVMSGSDITTALEKMHYRYGSTSILPVTKSEYTFLITLSYFRFGEGPPEATDDPSDIATEYSSIVSSYMSRFDIQHRGTNRSPRSYISDIEDALSGFENTRFRLTHSDVGF